MEVLQYIDRDEVKHLLELLQPQERVNTRAPKERPKLPNDNDSHKPLGEIVRQILDEPPSPRLSPKRRRCAARSRNYEIVDYSAEHYHRRGTWTAAMVASALANHNTHDAERWLREKYPEFANRSIDWSWLADKRNYIRFH